ncbi:hypothetical protein ACFW16_32675 [Inquilinus sp. NPDC058860]|uniref:hypothetical protein n=1 Tax=Inquilinus sp. NPDC058860 TaxID=3346652 RepID=UPI0036CE1290
MAKGPYKIIETFPLSGGKSPDSDIATWDQARYEAELAKAAEEAKTGEFAELAQLNELAIQSPAAAAACEIAAAACNYEEFPLLGFQHKFWPADENTDDYDNARIMWAHEGHVYRLDLGYNVITGEGDLGLEVDKIPVMDVRVEMSGWDKPPRIDGSRLPEDLASPDGKIRGTVTGGHEYEPGPWEAVLIGVGDQLRQLQAA